MGVGRLGSRKIALGCGAQALCFKGPHTGLTMLKWRQSSQAARHPEFASVLVFLVLLCFVLPYRFFFPPIIFVVLGEVRRPFEGKFSFTYNRKVTEKF